MILSDGIRELFREAVKHAKILNLNPDYWRIEVLTPDAPASIPAGSVKELLNFRERGKVVFIHTFCDNKNCLLEIYIDNMVMRGTPKDIYDLGLIGYNPTTFWLSTYDETNNRYVVMFTPIPPKEYFGRIYARLYAPRDSAINYKYMAIRYKYIGD